MPLFTKHYKGKQALSELLEKKSFVIIKQIDDVIDVKISH